MQHSTPKPTDADIQRFERIKALGCIACKIIGFYTRNPEIHHQLSGNRRISHQHTVGLCPWHHQGHVPNNMANAAMAEKLFGPSLQRSSKRFREVFGTDEELLAKQNALLEAA